MKFFIDTANLEQIRRFKEMGLLDGEPPILPWSQRRAGVTSAR